MLVNLKLDFNFGNIIVTYPLSNVKNGTNCKDVAYSSYAADIYRENKFLFEWS